jgi:hypothetical protein
LGLRDQEHLDRTRKGTEEERAWLGETINDRAAPTSGIVRAVRGANGVSLVARHGAVLAERKRFALEALSSQFERKAQSREFFGRKAKIGRLS